MAHSQDQQLDQIPLEQGSYLGSEAARLLGTSTAKIRRWMKGYTYKENGLERKVGPLWQSQLSLNDEHLEIGFRDLIELRFVKSFTDAGVGLLAVRNCLEYARKCVDDDHPFSTQRFRTDGRTIFLESLDNLKDEKLLDLKKQQYVFKKIIERSFKDLDVEDGAVARWRPFRGKQSIVIDPERSFGQPIADRYGVPTVVLADAVKAEGSIAKAARVYEVTPAVIRDAVAFENGLAAA